MSVADLLSAHCNILELQVIKCPVEIDEILPRYHRAQAPIRLMWGYLRIPVKVATQSTGKLPPKPVKAATPSERSDAGSLFLLYLVSCRQICLLFSE